MRRFATVPLLQRKRGKKMPGRKSWPGKLTMTDGLAGHHGVDCCRCGFVVARQKDESRPRASFRRAVAEPRGDRFDVDPARLNVFGSIASPRRLRQTRSSSVSRRPQAEFRVKAAANRPLCVTNSLADSHSVCLRSLRPCEPFQAIANRRASGPSGHR